jgi:molybdopterin-synthase adenylyltransferase
MTLDEGGLALLSKKRASLLRKKMYRLANNLEIYSKGSDSITLIRRGTGDLYDVECDQSGKNLIEKLKAGNGLISSDDISQEEEEAFGFLVNEKFLTRDEIHDSNSPDRTQRQTFREWGVNPHQAIMQVKDAKIAIIGCGGVGSWLALQLVSMGFKNFLLIDPDHVEEANVARQVYSRSHLGISKVDALEEILLERSEDVNISKKKLFVSEATEFDSLLLSSNFICIAADSPSREKVGEVVGKWASENNKAYHVCGGYSGHNSALGLTVLSGKTPCWSCYKSWYQTVVPPHVLNSNPILQGPVNPAGLIPTVLIAAAMSAYDVLRVTIGLEPVLVGKRLDLWPQELNFEKYEFQKNPNCIACGVSS